MIKMLSLLSGQKLLSPEETWQHQVDIDNLRIKQLALEELSNKLRTEIKYQQIQGQETLKASLAEKDFALAVKQSEINSLKEAYAQLNQSVDIETQRQIKENSELLGQLNWVSGTIAHDFRAPLRAIDAYSFFLADELGGNAPAEASQCLEEIRRNGKRMGVLLDALIEYLRLGVCPLNLQTHKLHDSFTLIINEHFEASPVPIELNVQGTWRVDQAMMMRLGKELIDNAIKFSKGVKDPKIIIRQSSLYNLEIIDNGVGFSETHDARKFQLFHRMHGNDEFEGEGIGLATAERIASRHHITLRLNRVGNQTVASLQLPEQL